jgi:hypothetical protein
MDEDGTREDSNPSQTEKQICRGLPIITRIKRAESPKWKLLFHAGVSYQEISTNRKKNGEIREKKFSTADAGQIVQPGKKMGPSTAAAR